ncbi:MAG: methylmalonyl Co-A mutase-associated GTPase MeaB [Roseivirga sp.]|uniref:methylmalonyl Co-A mutase-associated GTPase MeaB n=1 Tax=Roseivirga sp. TaxID=1964215 RepID=UPI001B03DFF1|nr:methylmalonyl Co-A mutase-associated GTPase MeaB [Roseivirga sp.]MBO6660857.1 methylmalonyl Co-A mutase-associated GTPase MeaB [Roseivirga sp.]MBO6761946.1 methylmalonyl Co-A mutase-associated GTPase MeaB [Roseivirga sp.]MBO6909159.1 methylmalonyl Co-A mutase-associated GTPase MeaB [Roseivirga sp.]
MKRRKLSTEELVEGIRSGNRVILSRAITLIESNREEDQRQAEDLLQAILPDTGKSFRLGITGVPGVGKSTFIESFGTLLTEKGKKLAVLTIDPSSQRTKGSILGDKTRMEELARNPNAFIRPSASGSTLGGVSGKTREVMLLCEAAGFDFIIIETVGVGQSETHVHGMVDFFLLLMLAGAGDELQGIKKGIMEMADSVVINKADGDNLKAAKRAKVEYQNALHLFPANPSGWIPQVKTCSALDKSGLEEVFEMLTKFQTQVVGNGFFDKNRANQQVSWFKENLNELLKISFFKKPEVQQRYQEKLQEVQSGKTPALNAAYDVLNAF